jgi:hypothetical protein
MVNPIKKGARRCHPHPTFSTRAASMFGSFRTVFMGKLILEALSSKSSRVSAPSLFDFLYCTVFLHPNSCSHRCVVER